MAQLLEGSEASDHRRTIRAVPGLGPSKGRFRQTPSTFAFGGQARPMNGLLGAQWRQFAGVRMPLADPSC
jgi:hypothetical protein